MTTEATGAGGNPNPADANADSNANPQGQAATVPPTSEGQGKDGTAPTGAETAQVEPEQVPETYAAFTVPEGFKLEGDRLAAATEFFKSSKMTQSQAQAAVDMFTRLTGEDSTAMQAAMETARQQQTEEWGRQAKAQLGDKYDETIGYATTAVKAINDPDVTAAFNDLGWGNHPAMIKAFAFFGRITRDSPMEGLGGETAASAEPPDHKTVLYGPKQ